MNDVKLTVLGGEGTGKSGKCIFFSGVEYTESEKYIDIIYIYINILHTHVIGLI